MNFILTITDEDFELECKPFDNPMVRYAARGIIVNNDGKIALLNKEKNNEYKLIGVGIKELEDPIQAFKRKALEESGYIIEIDDCMGCVKELKSQDNFQLATKEITKNYQFRYSILLDNYYVKKKYLKIFD